MARKDRGRAGRRPPNRAAGRRPPTAPPTRSAIEDQPLLRDLRRSLRAGPMEFVQAVSMILSAVAPAADDRAAAGSGVAPDGVDLPSLVESFIGTDIAETTAAMHVLAALTEDELASVRMRRELARRQQPVPEEITELTRVEPRAAWLLHDNLGDGENVFLELAWPSGSRASVVAYVDHAAGTRVKDAFAVDSPIEPLLDHYRQAAATQQDLEGSELSRLDHADARATLEHALAGVHYVEGDPEETWPALRPFVELVVRRLPAGGSRYLGPPAFAAPPDPAVVLRDFLGSPEGGGVRGPAMQLAARQLLEHAAGRFGHALRWTPRTVEAALIEQLPFDGTFDESALPAVPSVLPHLVRYAYRVLDLPALDRGHTLQAVAMYSVDFDDLVDSDGEPDGGWDAIDDGFDEADELDALLQGNPGPLFRTYVAEIVGGEQALGRLTAKPLPDEPLDLQGLDDDVATVVAEVADRIDGWFAHERADGNAADYVEWRTACRRYLRGIAERDPAVLRRRARAESTADAVMWTIGRANFIVGQGEGQLRAKDLHGWFGVAAPTSRAESLRRAFTGTDGPSDAPLGDTRVLVGRFRQFILDGLVTFAQQ